MTGANKVETYTTNILVFSSKAVIANFFLSISLTLWVVDKVFVVEYLLYSSFFSINYMFISENIRKNIFTTLFILVSANKKVSLKN